MIHSWSYDLLGGLRLLSKRGRGQCSHPASPHCCFADARLPGILGWVGVGRRKRRLTDGGGRPEIQTILPLPARDIRGPNPKAMSMGMECRPSPSPPSSGRVTKTIRLKSDTKEDHCGGEGGREGEGPGKRGKVSKFFFSPCPNLRSGFSFLSFSPYFVTAWL